MSKVMNNNENYSSNFNKAVFNGNLASDPRLINFNTKSGKSVNMTYFRVLADNYYNGYKTTSSMNCVAYGKHAVNIAKNFHKGDFVEANSTINTFPAKKIQGVSFKYPVTITRFNVYRLDNLMNRKHTAKVIKNPFATGKQSAPKAKKQAPKAKAKKQTPKAKAKKAKKPAKEQGKKVATK